VALQFPFDRLHPTPAPIRLSRPVTFRELFEREFATLKDKHGHGVYSWAEGMNRRVARKIARTRARRRMSKGE